jgi:hypothetical protein
MRKKSEAEGVLTLSKIKLMVKNEKFELDDIKLILAYKRANPKMTEEDIMRHLGISQRLAQTVRFLLRNEDELKQALTRHPKYRVLLAGDLHCGHMAGLTPKGYQIPESHDNPVHRTFAQFQRETWDFFDKSIMSLKPFTHAIWNGDLIDGSGKKSKGTELITTDRLLQGEMAQKVIETVDAGVNVISFGTGYHTGEGEDFESVIAANTGAIINAENLLKIGDVIFNVKHHVGGSGTPYGAATPILRDAIWSDLWSQLEDNPNAQIIVRSHAHTFIQVDDGSRHAIVLPALQGAFTKFGTRRCSKIVHWGFVYVDIYSDGTFDLHRVIYLPDSQKRKLIEL